jgi:Ca2+-binding RTX toxin-like protein
VGGVAEDVILNIENVTGGTAADTLTGDSLANVLSGGGGNDILKGGLGADTLDGGANVDTADYSDKTTTVKTTLNGAGGVWVFEGGVAQDVILNVENVTGGTAADTLTGDSLANVLSGNAGNDILNGGLGNDALSGGAGNDTLVGDAGTDIAVYSGASSNYRTTQNADGSWTITDLRAGAPEGTDRLVGIETLKFLGGSASASAAAIPYEGAEHMHPPDNMPLPQAHSDRFQYGDFLQTKLSALSTKSGLAADDLIDFLESSAWASVSHTEGGQHEHDLQFRHASQHHFDDWMH